MLLEFIFILVLVEADAHPSHTQPSDCNTIQQHFYGVEVNGHHKGARETGPLGLPGKRGPAGDIGPPGTTGSRGVAGSKGDTGSKGEPGSVGNPGAVGTIGEKGECEIPAELTEELVELRKEITKLRTMARTCADIETSVSGYYLISPNPAVVKPFFVYCNFTALTFKTPPTDGGSANGAPCVFPFIYKEKRYDACTGVDVGKGLKWCSTTPNYDTDQKWGYCPKSVTVFGHDSADEISLPKCQSPKCYSRAIVYENSLLEINQVVLQSQNCRQYVKYRCQASTFNWPGYGPFASWTSPDGVEHHNWGGSPTENTCKCGMTGTCVNPEKQCNCDSNSEDIATSDEGYLVDKTQLPVIHLKFGDTDGAREHGWHTLGKLECFN